MFSFFKKKLYFNCPLLKNSLHFFYDDIRACCTNVKGPIFYNDYKGENVDWDYIYKKRKEIFKKINSPFNKELIPEECKGCCDINDFLSKEKHQDFSNKIEKIYFHNNMSCNAKCSYCTYSELERNSRYKVLPLIKELINKKILSPNALIYMSGGEITISPEFEELLSSLTSYLNSQIEILTSGIKYCKSIENGFIQNKLRLMISLDSGYRDTYLKIKRVDCFDKVVNNIRNYINISENAKKMITLKYIIVDNVNDNENEIEGFLKLAKDLGIINVRLDFDYEKYKFTKDKNVPLYYFDLYKKFDSSAKEKNLNVLTCSQIEAILDKSR